MYYAAKRESTPLDADADSDAFAQGRFKRGPSVGILAHFPNGTHLSVSIPVNGTGRQIFSDLTMISELSAPSNLAASQRIALALGHSPPHNLPAAAERSARMARHTRSGVAGISMCRTPRPASASTIALITAASAGVVPPSPPERTPSLFEGAGTSLSAVAKNGTVSARGIP